MSNFYLVTDSLRSENICRRDFVQYYLAATAVLEGDNPQKPVTELAANYLPSCSGVRFEHPSPYTPTISLLFLPFAIFNLHTASILWAIFSTAMIFLACGVTLKGCGHRGPRSTVLLFLLVIASTPAAYELALGNLNALLLLNLSAAWLFIESKPKTAAVLVGLSAILKPILWPILILAVIRRQYAFTFLASLFGILLVTLSLIVSGFAPWISWLEYVQSGEQFRYLLASRNLSVWTLGPRVFLGMDALDGVPVLSPLIDLPLSPAKFWSKILSILVAVSVIVSICFLALHSSLKSLLIKGILLSLVLSPVTWEHHLLILALVLPIKLSTWKSGFSNIWNIWMVTVLLSCIFCWDLWLALSQSLISVPGFSILLILITIVPIVTLAFDEFNCPAT